MKKSIVILVCILLSGICGCSIDKDTLVEKVNELENSEKRLAGIPVPDIVHNQIVIKFNNPLLNSISKQAIRDTIQNDYHFIIKDIDVCDCDPNGPELWTIDTTDILFIGVEGVVDGIDSDTGEKGVEGDLQFYITIQQPPLSGLYPSSMKTKIMPNNSEDITNIAILDTGIDYSHFSGQFLYNTHNTQNGFSDISGWDFVNHDKDILDDNGHGSLVAKIITSELDTNNIPFSILAVKAFNKAGKATYFDVVCGINYISKLPDIDIVNMSFGWYTLNEESILKSIMKSMEDNTLIIASAGNEGVNTDDEENAHFPSGYRLDNMITVGGYELRTISPNTLGLRVSEILNDLIIERSNFGVENIDLVAPFDGYDLVFNSHRIHPKGTSFSAAYTTAIAAQLNTRDLSVLQLKTTVINSTYYLENIDRFIKNGNVLVRNYINQNRH